MTTHLIIPDGHTHPDYNNDRFTWLGKLIVDLQPEVVVNIGDMAEMASLCSYEKGTKGFEGRRYKKDIATCIDANKKLFAPLQEYNETQRRGKRKIYKPRTVFTLGNHEYRIQRAVDADPILDGTISIDDLQLKKYWGEVYPFLDIVTIDGVAYSHFFSSGVMGRAIGGEHMAYSLLTKKFMSCTMGHTHTRDHSSRTRADGTKLNGLVCGVFQDYRAEWAGQANELWWSGVVIKRNVKYGDYDLEWMSIERLKELYGGNNDA